MADKDKPSDEIKVGVHKIGGEQSEFERNLLFGPGKNSPTNDGSNPNAAGANSLEYEDEFRNVYGVDGKWGTDVVVLEPPFNPLTLEKLVKHNNTLGPCIDAMVTNIDGTGYEIIFDEDTGSQEEANKLLGFLKEPYPGESFLTMRKKLRRDLETLGYAYIEVVRNPLTGKILALKYIEAKTIRLVKLGHQTPATRILMRDGKPQKVNINMRFRRFVQSVGSQYLFFKEFQADPHIDKKTGEWIKDEDLKSMTKKDLAKHAGSEIIYFTAEMDVNTPYGVPRWISQMPSVLGSRKAEENNLEFFDSGGIPPFMMVIEGGVLAEETKDMLDKALSTKNDTKQRGLVVEAHSSDGSLDGKANNVSVKVERFGSEKQNDSLFENYDRKSEERVRGAFRLPPIFVGKADSYNFASAFASYMVGEAQIFAPERQAFDEIISLKLLPELLNEAGKPNTPDCDKCIYKFRSLPITISDTKEKIMGIKLATDKESLTKGEMIRNLNEVIGLDMLVEQEEKDNIPTMNNDRGGDDPLRDSSVQGANLGDPSNEKDNQVI